MDWLRLLMMVALWLTPVAFVVAVAASRRVQRLVLPVVAVLILLMTVMAVARYWPRHRH